MRCIDCSENESNLVERCLSLEKYIDKKDILPKTDSLNISLPGSLIIQSLLHFHKPIKVIYFFKLSNLNLTIEKLYNCKNY